MNGAQALIASLTGAGVDVCFMNPGTSEMHFVAALDSVPQMRGVLALFEGVATGAADGYARIAGQPAAVLLHLGPGLANGLANLHNARRAGTPVLVIVGAHATGHVRYDAPLQSDIEALARTVSGWVHTSGTTRDLAHDAMRALAAARRGQIATLILPADVSWTDGAPSPHPAQPADPAPRPEHPDPSTRTAPPHPESEHRPSTMVDDSQVASVAGLLSPQALLFLGGRALSERGLRAASRISVATGARLLAETFPARMERGAGLPAVDRLAYLAEQAEAQLAGVEHLILAGARSPVSFFAYPGQRSDLVPDALLGGRSGRSRTRRGGGAGPARRPRRGRDQAAPGGPRGPPGRAGPADRDQPGQYDRRLAAGGRHHLRRGQHLGLRAACGPDRRGPAQPADLDRGLDRPGPARRHRRGDRRPGPAGAVAWRPTAARCTPSRPCGPRPASSST